VFFLHPIRADLVWSAAANRVYRFGGGGGGGAARRGV